jgi:nucleoside-diphosphate-sugar epimerase
MTQARPAVAVTGANGYVGGVICAALAAEMTVLRLVRKPEFAGDIAWSFEMEPAALAAALRERHVSRIVHAAWDMKASRLRDLENGAVTGSQRLLAAAALAGVEKVTFISTISAFEGARSAYGKAKLQVERLVLAVNGNVLRPGLVYGPGQGGMFGSLRKTVANAKFVPLIGDGSTPQYLLHAETLAQAVRLALSGALDGVMTLADPAPIAFRDLLRVLAGRELRLVPVPWQAFYAGLRSAEATGVKLGFKSDSVLSFIFQNPAPDFEPMLRAGIVPRRLEGM